MKLKQKNQMTVLTILLLLSILSGCRSAQTAPSAVTVVSDRPRESEVPKIIFASTEHDFGKVAADAKLTCSFDFTSSGEKDLVIEKIHASCGCTTAALQDSVIKPGQASKISVTYQVGASGKSKKQVKVYTNDPQNPEVSLWVSAEVEDSSKDTGTTVTNPASAPTEKQPPEKGMPKALKQALRNLNKTTGG
jgi:hypothetical protein